MGSLANATGSRSVMVTTIRFGPDARDGGRTHPVDGEQTPAALGQRDIEYALADVRREDGLWMRARLA